MDDPKKHTQTRERLGEVEPTLVEENPENRTLLAHELAEALFALETGHEVKFAGNKDLQEIYTVVNNIAEDPSSDLYIRLYGTEEELKEKELTRINPEVLEIFKHRINSEDSVTGLPQRDVQTEKLREKIAQIQYHKKDYEEYTNRIALITFDIRGLKMVNDVMKDHKHGDRYLHAIVEHTKTYILPVIKEITGEAGTVDFARDAGDEFSILMESSELRLDTSMSIPEFVERFSSIDMKEEFVASPHDSTTDSLLNILNKYLEFRLAQISNTIIPKEQLQEFAQTGEEDTYKLPEGFQMKFHVASGASTLSEVVEHVSNEDFKEDLTRMESGGFAIPESYKTPIDRAKFSVNKLLGALRTRADRRSYESKSRQNKHWIESEDPFDRVMIKMISRNDVTVSLAQKAQREQLARKKAENILEETKNKLKTCLEEKASLEVKNS